MYTYSIQVKAHIGHSWFQSSQSCSCTGLELSMSLQ